MDDNGLRNWGSYEQAFRSHMNLQHMSNVVDSGTQSSYLPVAGDPSMVHANNNGNGSYYHHHHHRHDPRDSVVSEPPSLLLGHMNYGMDGSWLNLRDNGYHQNMVPGANSSYYRHLMPDSSLHMLQLQPSSEDGIAARIEGDTRTVDNNNGHLNERRVNPAPKAPKTKKARKNPVIKDNGGSSSSCTSSVKQTRIKPKKSMEIFIEGIDMDITGIPIPICTCTEAPQQCYRWGCGGWQSACCTNSISMYPLPMSGKRRSARIAGRKMSQGAFKKVLEKLASEGYDFSNPIDLKSHWAKHGSNKFVRVSN